MRKNYEKYEDEIRDGLDADAVFNSFGFYSVPDLTQEEKQPPEFIVNGMIPVGLTFLSGAPKTRKSFLALQMAISVASGLPFFGFSTVKSSVAYLDLEGSKARTSSRTENLSVAIPHNVLITNQVSEKLSDNSLTEKIRLLHQARPEIRLVIIDTYSRARGIVKTFGQNAYDVDIRLLEPVQQMAISEKIAVVMVHHDRKGANACVDSFERLSGTMGISGSCDSVLNLTADGKRGSGKATLEYTPRDARSGELSLEFDEACLEWRAFQKTDDLSGNPMVKWLDEHCPAKGTEGVFYSYKTLYKAVYGIECENAGNKILLALKPLQDDIYERKKIGLQFGVKSHGQRGIRVIRLG